MDIVITLFSPDIIFATLVYFIVATGLITLTDYLTQHVDEMPMSDWYYKAFSFWYVMHVWIPIARALALLVFIAASYPVLFGLSNAPPILQLLSTDAHFSAILNTLFFISIILPLLPFISNVHAIVLPIQGITMSILLCNWIAPEYGVNDITYWPGFTVVLTLTVLTIISHFAAQCTAASIGEKLDSWLNRDGYTIIVYQVILLFFQCPIILSYSLFLGKQLL